MNKKEELRSIRQEVLKLVNDEDRDINVSDAIDMVVNNRHQRKGYSYEEAISIKENLRHHFLGMGVLDKLIRDPEVTEIMVNGADRIFYEKDGVIEAYEECFDSEEDLREIIDNIVSDHNRRVNRSEPIVDTRLKDGSRVNVVLPPVSLDGPIVTIRKFRKDIMDMDVLEEKGMVNSEIAALLKDAVRNKKSILITGGTGSGKTTLLNALSQSIPKDERIITIEDSAELMIQDAPNLIRLECRDGNVDGLKGIGIRELIKTSLRMRPDRIIIGETRGVEAIDFIQSLNTGHEGALSSLHSNSCKDAISRLAVMMLMGMDIPMEAIKSQIASGLDYIVHIRRGVGGMRKVDEVVRVKGIEDGEVVLEEVWKADID